MFTYGLCIAVTCEGALEAGSVEAVWVLSEWAAGNGLGLLPLPQTLISRCQDAYNTLVKIGPWGMEIQHWVNFGFFMSHKQGKIQRGLSVMFYFLA